MQVRACGNKNRTRNKKMLKQRLTGLVLIVIPLLVMLFGYMVGESVGMEFAIAICWPLGMVCLISKKYWLMT